MADNEKEIIKKIEAEALEAKPIVPEVLSSKRSAFINNKARSGGGCVSDCGIILSGIASGIVSSLNPTLSGFFHYNHDTNTYDPLLNSNGSFIGWRQDVARWGDKLYARFGGLYNPGNISQAMIQEYQINQDCTVTEIRNIIVAGRGSNIGHGMDMIDANTIVCGSTDGASIGAQPGVQYLLEVDISVSYPFTLPSLSNTVVCPATPGLIISSNATNAANVPPSLQGFWGGYKAVDIIYFEDTGRYLVSMVGLNSLSVDFPSLPNKVLRLFSSSGQLLDECPQPSGLGLYRKCNDIFLTGTDDNIHPVTFDPLTVHPPIQNSGITTNGTAYNSLEYSSAGSKCCAPIVTSTRCYEIGDIGPEGGIIFSVPGVGLNTSTNIYYEVAQNDIDTATTPSSCFNISCGDEVVTYDVTNGKATHQMLDDNEFTFYWNDTPNPPYPNVGSNPPPQVGDTLTAITPNLFADALGNPISTTTILSITPSTHPSGHGAFTVKIADQLTAALDQSGNNTLPFKFSLTTTVVSPCTSPTPVSVTIQPNTISQGSNTININYGPTFSLGIGTVSVPWNQSFNFINYAGWEVSGLDDNGNQLFPPNTTITSTTYPTVNNVGPYFTAQMFLSSPSLGNLTPSTVSSITLTATTGLTPFGLQGSEWGAYGIPHSGTPPTIQTSLDFGLGLDNTDIIHAFPGNPGTPTGGTHPWLNTHDIAATVCKNHGTTNDWFLPSVQEFKEMFTNVGPGSSAANQITFNPLTQKSEHLYWTSSQHIDNGTGLQDPDKYAYAYDTIANNTKLAYRCHTLSVRPIRKFECEIPVDEGIDYDYRLNMSGGGTAGVIDYLGQTQNLNINVENSVKAYSFEMPMIEHSINGTVIANGLPGGPTIIVPIIGPSPSTGTVVIEVPSASTFPTLYAQLLPPFDHLYYSGIAMTSVTDPNVPVGMTWLYFYGEYWAQNPPAPAGAWNPITGTGSFVPASVDIGSTHNNGDPILIEWLLGFQSDTAFLIDSQSIVSTNTTNNASIPTTYNPMLTTSTQLSAGNASNTNNITYNQFGQIDQIIDIANDPIHAPNLAFYQAQTGAPVDTIIVFSDPYGDVNPGATTIWPFLGPNGHWTYPNYPQFSFVDDIIWVEYQAATNLNWNPSPLWPSGIPYGTSGYEIGHPTFFWRGNGFDIRGNDMRALLHTGWVGGVNTYQNRIFNIKVYDQFEKLICDYDYKMVNANNYSSGPVDPHYPGCNYVECYFTFAGRLESVNYVDNSLSNASNDIVDLYPYFGSSNSYWGRKGNGYFSITLKNPPANPLLIGGWNSSMTRGNTLNLQNWLGQGNHRSTSISNLPTAYNTTLNRFGWGVVCRPCGVNVPGNGCYNLAKREWMAEVPWSSSLNHCVNYTGSYTMHYPGFGTNTGQGWIDANSAGCPERPIDDCGILITGTKSSPAHAGVFYYDHNSMTSTEIPGPSLSADIARWDNKFYQDKTLNGIHGVEEWELDPVNLTATFIRHIPIYNSSGLNHGIGVGMDMKDANTIIAGSVGSQGAYNIVEIDISGNTGISTNLFPTTHIVAGDIIYMQDTGWTLVTHGGSGGGFVMKLYNHNGIEIDSTPHSGGLGMYRHPSGDVFASSGQDFHRVTFNPLNVVQNLGSSGIAVSGAAYNNNPQSDCSLPPNVTTGISAKLAQNYPNDIKSCFDEQQQGYTLEEQNLLGIEEEFNAVIFPPTQQTKNKRQKFIYDKTPKETGPFGINGYYPLYDTINGAIHRSPTPIESRDGEYTYGYHIHEFNGVEYYMPNGLEMGVTQFHGDYDGQIIPETIVEPEVTEDIPEIIETPDIPTVTLPPIITEPEEEPEEETPSPPSDTGY